MLKKIFNLVRYVGEEIIKIYRKNNIMNIEYKNDFSPITTADIIAHNILVKELNNYYPNIPILSEEKSQSWNFRKYWNNYWIIDPLDGTKEFIRKNNEFTINIALIKKYKPILGIIYAPALDVLYYSIKNFAWKEFKNEKRIRIFIKNKFHIPTVLISRSHCNHVNSLSKYLKSLGKHKILKVGSSLKFCFIAEGKAQFYPRFGLTNIWDTAAGEAIAKAAGAKIYDWKGKKLNYKPNKSFLNPGFHVSVI